MMFKIFQCNYGFYASTGVKVEMQKRRRFLFTHYWAYTHAPKLALGFNYVYGHLKLKKLQPYKGLQPEINGWSLYNFTINNLSSRYLVGLYRKLDFPRGWADWAYCALPEIRFAGNDIVNRDELNKMFESGFEMGAKATINMIGKGVGMNKIGQRDPKIAYGIWGPNDYEFKEQNPYLTGVKEYTGMASKTIYFSRSWGVVVGVNFNSNGHLGALGISGNTDVQFKIDHIDAFGAAYYDGHWKGIRMYN